MNQICSGKCSAIFRLIEWDGFRSIRCLAGPDEILYYQWSGKTQAKNIICPRNEIENISYIDIDGEALCEDDQPYEKVASVIGHPVR